YTYRRFNFSAFRSIRAYCVPNIVLVQSEDKVCHEGLVTKYLLSFSNKKSMENQQPKTNFRNLDVSMTKAIGE
ncbi:unnamed protein product, partial [Sphenostylis stenocarpa]